MGRVAVDVDLAFDHHEDRTRTAIARHGRPPWQPAVVRRVPRPRRSSWSTVNRHTSRYVCFVPILLQKSLMAPAWSDSLVQTRFGVEAGDDGAAQSRPKAAVLFI